MRVPSADMATAIQFVNGAPLTCHDAPEFVETKIGQPGMGVEKLYGSGLTAAARIFASAEAASAYQFVTGAPVSVHCCARMESDAARQDRIKTKETARR